MIVRNSLFLLVFSLLFANYSFNLFASEVGTRRLKSGIVKIKGVGRNGPTEGSGFIFKLDKDVVYILTACHIVQKDSNPKVEFFTYSEGRTYVYVNSNRIAMDIEKDLAILKIVNNVDIPKDEDLFVYQFFFYPLKEHNTVKIIGVPRQINNWIITDGKIIHPGSKTYFVGFTAPGNSGGPLIKDDRVVGLVSESVRASYTYAIPATMIELFLLDHNIKLR